MKNSKKQEIVFFPTHQATVNEMLPVAERIRNSTIYEPVFLITRKGKLTGLEEENLRKVYKVRELAGVADTKLFDFFRKMTRFSPRFFGEFINYYLDFRNCRKVAVKFLQVVEPAALLHLGDRSIGWETAFIKEAINRSIPSVILPFAYSHPVIAVWHREAKVDFENAYLAKGFFRKTVSVFKPSWLYCYQGKSYYFYPMTQALAAFFCGIMPDLPWVMAGGRADTVAAESALMRDLFIEQGVDKSKIEVTGKPSLDQMANDVTSFASESKLERQVLYSIPQYAEVGLSSWTEHKKMTEKVLKVLRSMDNVKVVISLHPRSRSSDYQKLADKYNAEISQKPAYDLLLNSDLVVCGASSIVLVALALKKMVLSLHYLTPNVSAMPEAERLLIINDMNDLADSVRTWESHMEQRANNIICVDEYWGLFDGKSTERVADLITREIEKNRKS